MPSGPSRSSASMLEYGSAIYAAGNDDTGIRTRSTLYDAPGDTPGENGSGWRTAAAGWPRAAAPSAGRAEDAVTGVGTDEPSRVGRRAATTAIAAAAAAAATPAAPIPSRKRRRACARRA